MLCHRILPWNCGPPPLLYLKGFHAIQSYRITHYLWNQNRKALALYLQNQISVAFDVDIHPAAKIGHGIMFDHATGIVVGETSVIENDVALSCKVHPGWVQVKNPAIAIQKYEKA